MSQIFEAIGQNWFWSMLGFIAVVWIIFATIESIFAKASRERSRREIAAYIAEGSMTPEQGERLMKAAPPESEV
jgi:hypothetical protein